MAGQVVTYTIEESMAAKTMYIRMAGSASRILFQGCQTGEWSVVPMHCSAEVVISRSAQNFQGIRGASSDLAFKSVMALRRRIDTGSFGGFPAKTFSMASRQNCIRKWPIEGLETVSAAARARRFRVRRAS